MRSAIGIIAGFLLLLWLLHPAGAADPPQRVSCWQIRQWVALHGKETVRQAARSRGYTETEISDAERRCLK